MRTESPPTLDGQRQYWEVWNASLRDPDRLNDWCERRAETILEELGSLRLESPEILDLGCGTGWLSDRLARIGPTTAIDLAEGVIANAKSRFPKVRFLAGDILQAPLPSSHFDVVVSQEVIAHVLDQKAYLDRAADLLKPGGHLIITTPNKFVVERADFPPQPPEHIEKWLTMRELKKLVQMRFHVLSATTILPMGSRGLLRWINSPRVERTVGAFLPRARLVAAKERLGLGYTLVIVAQKRT